MPQTRWLDNEERHAWRGYLAMHAQLTGQLNRQLQADSGLSLSDFDVLVQLTDQPRKRIRVGELAEALQWEKSRASHHLARMQRRGLIERKTCPDDARGSYIALTRNGRRGIERAAPAHVDTVRELVFSQLSREQVRTLGTITDRVLNRLSEDR